MTPKLPSQVTAEDRVWHIERYVLADPTLDRRAFEAAMAEDLELALAVAESVEQLQGLALVCREHPRRVTRGPSEAGAARGLARRSQRLALVASAVAAGLLLAFFPWAGHRPARELAGFSQPSASRGAEQQLAAVAQQWIDLTSIDVRIGTVPGPAGELAEFEGHSPANLPDDQDWMLQVSAAFFEESES